MKVRLAVARGQLWKTGAIQATAATQAASPDVPSGQTDEEEGVAFKMVADSGRACEDQEYPYALVHDLETMVFGQRIPVRFRHQTPLGITRSVRVHRGRLEVEGALQSSPFDLLARNVVQSARAGNLWQASAHTVFNILEYIEEGECVRVNNRTFHGPILVARAARLVEVSATPDHESVDVNTYTVIKGTTEFDFCSGETLPSRKEIIQGLVRYELEVQALEAQKAEMARFWERLQQQQQIELAARLRQESEAMLQERRDREINIIRNREDREREAAEKLRATVDWPMSLAQRIQQNERLAEERQIERMKALQQRCSGRQYSMEIYGW